MISCLDPSTGSFVVFTLTKMFFKQIYLEFELLLHGPRITLGRFWAREKWDCFWREGAF